MSKRTARAKYAPSIWDERLVAELQPIFGLEQKYLHPFAMPAGQQYAPEPYAARLKALDGALAKSPDDAESLAKRGRLLRLVGRKAEALADLDRAIELEPEHARALAWRGELLAHVGGKRELGFVDLEAAALLLPADPLPRVWIGAARLAANEQMEALAALDAALEAAPDDACARFLRAAARARTSKKEEVEAALKDADAAAKLAPECMGPAIFRARLLATLQRDDDAAAILSETVRRDPDVKMFFAFLLDPAGSVENDARGMGLMDAYLEKHPDAAWCWALRGDLLRTARFDKGREGAEDLRRAAKLAPKAAWIRALLGRALVQDIYLDEGIGHIEAAVKMDPECAWLHSWRGEACRRLKRFDESVKHFKTAIKKDPRYAQPRLWLGRLLAEAKEWTKAIPEFEAAIQLDPAYGYAYAKRGQALAALGRHAEAEADYGRALNLKLPGEREWVLGLRSRSRFARADYAGAFEDLGRAIRHDIKSSWAPLEYGGKSINPASWDALAGLDEAVEQNPIAGWLRAWRGAVQLGLGRINEGLSDLDNAARIDPNYAWTHAWRGRVLWQTGKLDEAVPELDAALRRDPDCAWLWSWRAELRNSRGEFTAALADADAAVALRGRSAHAHFTRGEALRGLGRHQEGRAALDRALQLEPEHLLALVSRALLRGEVQDFGGQMNDFREVARLAPDLFRRLAMSVKSAHAGSDALDVEQLIETWMKQSPPASADAPGGAETVKNA